MISVHSWILKIYSSEFVLYSIRFEIIGCKWIFNTEICKELNLEVFHQFFISCILARHFGINYGNLCLMQRMFFRRCFNSVNFSIDECMVTVKNVWVVLNSEFVSRGSRVVPMRMLGFKSSGDRTKEQTCSAYKVEVDIFCPVNWLTIHENVAS